MLFQLDVQQLLKLTNYVQIIIKARPQVVRLDTTGLYSLQPINQK